MNKLNGIFYNGEYGNYSLKGESSKDNAYLEFKRRAKLIELAENNIGTFEQIVNNNLNLFHGTNINALPGILKYGMLSENESYKIQNPVTTGEEWSRINGCRRDFISFTDQLESALNYAYIQSSEKSSLGSFGIIIGISSNDIKDLKSFKVPSDLPELGIVDRIPTSRIKTIFTPVEKIGFISNIVKGTGIQVTAFDMLSQSISKLEYGQEDISNLANTRKTSRIKRIFDMIKAKEKHSLNLDRNGDNAYDRD